MDDIKARWEAYQKQTFPEGIHGKTIQDINLTLLHCDTASCVMTAINMDGMLSTRAKNQLVTCVEQLEIVIPEMGQVQQEFFKELLVIAKELKAKVRTP
ncbi:MAG: hypothetical protein KDD62_05185 [Bdellovibrionales bacterium]|nr:hypothetical protein [Bdellovibrionales bacterium]